MGYSRACNITRWNDFNRSIINNYMSKYTDKLKDVELNVPQKYKLMLEDRDTLISELEDIISTLKGELQEKDLTNIE